ncbi:MAG: hypothetical protein FJ344_05015, partial [Sphingomonadales bacterium]|nr:hypothetical protein [Sphingomonadales bacterium]
MRSRLSMIFTLLACLFCSVVAFAQPANQVAIRITNQVAVSPTVYEFDVYLQNTGTNVARSAGLQFGLGI